METIKEEKKAELEPLLNGLIEKGWEPFGCNYERYEHGCLIHEFTTKDGVYSYGQYPTTIREFCAKESGLWQFVCENDLYPPYIKHRRFRDLPTNGLQIHDYRYWVIESALTDESELEDFLLSNIKIDDAND